MNTPDPRDSEVITQWTLELADRGALCPKRVDRADVVIRRAEIPLPAFNRFLHTVVGTEFRWDGRTDWTEATWRAFVDRAELETWVLYVEGTPAGYFETEHFEDGSARIHNFGLLRPFFGQGLGAHLLTFAAHRAFDRGAERLWLNTCTKDHPHALPNYKARGFKVICEQQITNWNE